MLDDAFELTRHSGDKLKEIFSNMLDENDGMNIMSVPIDARLGFIYWLAEREGKSPKRTLLLNQGMITSAFEWADHAVIKWMRRVHSTPGPILSAQVNQRAAEATAAGNVPYLVR